MTVRDFLKLATCDIRVVDIEDNDTIIRINSCYSDRNLFSKRLLDSEVKTVKAENNILNLYIDSDYLVSSAAQS